MPSLKSDIADNLLFDPKIYRKYHDRLSAFLSTNIAKAINYATSYYNRGIVYYNQNL